MTALISPPLAAQPRQDSEIATEGETSPGVPSASPSDRDVEGASVYTGVRKADHQEPDFRGHGIEEPVRKLRQNLDTLSGAELNAPLGGL